MTCPLGMKKVTEAQCKQFCRKKCEGLEFFRREDTKMFNKAQRAGKKGAKNRIGKHNFQSPYSAHFRQPRKSADA